MSIAWLPSTNPAAGPLAIAEAVPISISLVQFFSPECTMSALPPAEELDASHQKKRRRRKKHREQVEAIAASSEPPPPPASPESKPKSTIPVAPETLTSAAVRESPRPLGNPESKSESPLLVAPETLASAVMAAAAVRLVKERERKNQVVPPASPLMEEPVWKEEKQRKKRKHVGAALVVPSPPTPDAAQNLRMEAKMMAEGATVRKKQRRLKAGQEQSGEPPFSIDVHPQGGEEATDDGGVGVMVTQCVKRSKSKNSRVLKTQQTLPQGFFPPMANPNSIDQDPNYSSPFGAFFAQFAYKPANIADRPARLPPRGHPSSGSSLLTGKETSKAAWTATSNTKQPCPASESTSDSQEEARIEGKEKPEKKMTREMAVRESTRHLAILESMSASSVPVAPETPTSAAMTAATVMQDKECKRENQEALPAAPLIEDPVPKVEKRHKKRKVAQITQMENKVMTEGATVRKKHRRQKVKQEQSGQTPFLNDVYSKAGEEAAAGGVMGSQCVKRIDRSKNSKVLKKQQTLPQGFFPPIANPEFIDQDPNYCSPFGAFFAQFAYKPERRQDGNGSPLPSTTGRTARLPPRGHPLSGSSLLTAKEVSKAARTTTLNTKQPCPASESTSDSQEEARIEGKEKPEKKMTREMAARESPRHLAILESMSASSVPVAPETLTSAMTAATVMQDKERKRENPEALPAAPLIEDPVPKVEKRHKKRKDREAAMIIPSVPTAAVAQITQMEKKVMTEGATVRKKHRRRKVEQEQSGETPFLNDVYSRAGEEAAAGGVMGRQCVKRINRSKNSKVLKKQQTLPQGFFPPIANPDFIDQDPNYCSPFGAFFAQFAYKPERRQDGNGSPLPSTTGRTARLPPRGHPSSGSSLLTAKEVSKAARTTTLNTKQACPASASISSSQEGVRVKGKKKPEEKTTMEKKPRKPPILLSPAEKWSDKYRRLPLDQLVPPPRSPHKLLQEKYASDPWKVIVICMLLNLTQGKQVTLQFFLLCVISVNVT
jgi:ribosomal protein L24